MTNLFHRKFFPDSLVFIAFNAIVIQKRKGPRF